MSARLFRSPMRRGGTLTYLHSDQPGGKRGGNDFSFEPNYTGQRLDDTVIPDPTNVLAYNRYLYANGNPFKYNDPTGHVLCCFTGLPTL